MAFAGWEAGAARLAGGGDASWHSPCQLAVSQEGEIMPVGIRRVGERDEGGRGASMARMDGWIYLFGGGGRLGGYRSRDIYLPRRPGADASWRSPCQLALTTMPVGSQPGEVDHASWHSRCQLAVGWAWDLEKSETVGSRCQLALTMPVGADDASWHSPCQLALLLGVGFRKNFFRSSLTLRQTFC